MSDWVVVGVPTSAGAHHAGQFPGQSEIVGREVVADVKGRHLMVDKFAQLFGLAVAAGE